MPSAAQELVGEFGLVADIGGTHARFGLVDRTFKVKALEKFASTDYSSPLPAIRDYLAHHPGAKISRAALAVATSVTGDLVAFTNSPWSFSIAELRQALQIQQLTILNDFAALAHALPYLKADELRQIGEGVAQDHAPKGVLGPGTGLGVAGLIAHGDQWLAVPGEGGHASVSPADEREAAILAFVRREHPHVSWERLVSGIGFPTLLQAVAAVDGFPYHAKTPAEITQAAHDNDPLALAVIHTFCALLGSAAGNLALTLGALGGIYIGGGIVPRLGALFDCSPFRQRFESKGRFYTYLKRIPTWVITAESPALTGAAHTLNQE